MQARLKRRQIQHRPIQHPRFANISAAAARAALSNHDGPWGQQDKFRREISQDGATDGDALFSPSSKGADRLSLSIRLFSTADAPIVQNIDLMETKTTKVGTHLTLGTPLKIRVFQYHKDEDLSFDDLDEVLVRFVTPYVHKFAEIRRHKKFVEGPPVRIPFPPFPRASTCACESFCCDTQT